jgi:hypothetical protein
MADRNLPLFEVEYELPDHHGFWNARATSKQKARDVVLKKWPDAKIGKILKIG